MQRDNMGQLVNTEFPGERARERESSLGDSSRHCIILGKQLFARLRGGFTSFRSVLRAGVLLSLFVTSSFAQAQQPYTATLQPRSAEDVEQLVAPVALYPDALLAQVLAASTYPTQVVQADRWLKANNGLQGQQLAVAADQQPWDASVKALTAFPSVLSNMDENLSWTTELGEVYFNQQEDVMSAVQALRDRAQQAGTLRTTTQERVVSEGTSIVIEPAAADVCYLPEYDPWLVYGAPIVPFPGYYYGPWLGSTFVSFGPAIRLGFFGGFGWGWPAWGFNWGRHVLVFNRVPYVSDSHFFYGRGPFGGFRGGFAGRPARDFGRDNHAFFPNRSLGPNRFGGNYDGRAGNFRSFDHGGGFRGVPRVGGGGRGPGGGFHGGGFHGGGGHHR
jgi:hypothetical protein